MNGKNLTDAKGRNVGYMTKSPDCPEGLHGKQYSATASLLRCAAEDYAIINAEVHRANGNYDFPFCYGEKQNQPIMWHCLWRTSGNLLSIPWAEQRWNKKRRGKDPQRQFLDYVVSLGRDGEIVLWIEYKHRVGYLNRKQRSEALEDRLINDFGMIVQEWHDDKKKLDKMNPKTYEDLWRWSSKSKLVKVNLLTMPICDRENGEKSSKEKVESIKPKELNRWVNRVREGLQQDMKSPINWYAAWALHSELLQNPVDWIDDKGTKWVDIYPAVFFFAQVLPPEST